MPDKKDTIKTKQLTQKYYKHSAGETLGSVLNVTFAFNIIFKCKYQQEESFEI